MKTPRFLSLFCLSVPSFPNSIWERTCPGDFVALVRKHVSFPRKDRQYNFGMTVSAVPSPPISPIGPISPILLCLLLLSGLTHAQDTTTPAASASHVVDVPQPLQPDQAAAAKNLSDAQIAEYQKRFDQGYALQQAGKLQEARKIYDGILAEQPEAKRSLLEAGRISFQLGELPKAETYLEKLHEVVPDFPEAIELLIQINQALGRDVAVELLVRDFGDLRNSGKIPELQQSLCFVRERVPFHDESIVVSQFFDYTTDPNTVWMGEVYDAAGKLKQRLLLNYDPDATRALRAKDDKYAHTQVFTWFGHDLKDGQVTTINAYLQIFALPDYNKFRSAMLVILDNPPKPIYSAPVPASSGQ
jgi:tetratricopeptide (TPR) repeat protein